MVAQSSDEVSHTVFISFSITSLQHRVFHSNFNPLQQVKGFLLNGIPVYFQTQTKFVQWCQIFESILSFSMFLLVPFVAGSSINC